MLGIIVAMQKEADILLDISDIKNSFEKYEKIFYEGSYKNIKFALCICGVGKVNAGIGTQFLIDSYNVDKILSFGVAGGVSEKAKLKGVYQIKKGVQYDFDLSKINGTQIGTLNEYTTPFLDCNTLPLPIPSLVLASGDRFSDDSKDFLLITKTLKADIRDMEGTAIMQVAKKANIPLYMFKTISDVAKNGDTASQYKKNYLQALENLKKELPIIFERKENENTKLS